MYILYEGPSRIDGKPLVVIATDKTRNPKADMVQTWILRQDIDPVSANRTGADRSICGDCPHKGQVDLDKTKGMAPERTCYVNIMGPNGIYKAYKAGRYMRLNVLQTEAAFVGRKIRLGSYGDPAAVPQYVWDALLKGSAGHTGYSHQSNANGDQVMISADSEAQARQAWALGKRTFRVVGSIADIVSGKEVLCPASEEAGKRTTCAQCTLCSGSLIKAKSIAIKVHGPGKKHFKEERA
jgi:hypothetical protein